jgi:hypothetical protein
LWPDLADDLDEQVRRLEQIGRPERVRANHLGP